MATEVDSVAPVKDEKNIAGEDEASGGMREVTESEERSKSPKLDKPTEGGNAGADGDAAGTPMVQTEGVPKEMLVKHPLQYRWVLWYCKQDRSKPWEECLKEVASFDTVEDFWALYNHIQLASGLSWGSDYYLFKEGIRPMWEDPHNVEGGRWLIQVEKGRRNELLDTYWLELLMSVIGEQFEDHGEYICGLVINVRQKGDKVSLWTRDATKEEVNKCIGQIVKLKLEIPTGEMISYEQHKDTSHKSSSMVKPRLRV